MLGHAQHEASWRRLGSVLEASGGVLEASGGVLEALGGALEAPLEAEVGQDSGKLNPQERNSLRITKRIEPPWTPLGGL